MQDLTNKKGLGSDDFSTNFSKEYTCRHQITARFAHLAQEKRIIAIFSLKVSQG